MQAVRVHKYGGPEVLQVETVPIPQPQKNQVVIQVKAIGINPIEVYIRSGMWEALVVAGGGAPFMKFPYTPGTDAAGIVTAVGEDVRDWQVGDRVFTCDFGQSSGAYAQYMAAEASHVFRLPGYLTYSEGAALGMPYFTTVKALINQAKAKKGQSLLVHGASGGVGIATVQLGKTLGMDVVGTASTEDGSKLVMAHGARLVLNHKDKDHKQNLKNATDGKGFDVIVEMLADVNLPLDLEVIKFGGRLVLVGSRGKVEISPWAIIEKEVGVLGDALWLSSEKEWKNMGKELAKAMEGSQSDPSLVQPVIERELRLDNAPLAHKEVMEHKNGAKGKIVLIP